MKSRVSFVGLLLGLCCLAALFGFQSDGKVDRAQMKAILTELGFEVKDLVKDEGKEKYQITISRGGLDIPIGVEQSSNGNFIWLTANLGPVPNGEKALKLLRQNASIQPSQFYVTKSDLLMCGLPVENKLMNNAHMRQRVDAFATAIVNSEEDWRAGSH